MKPAHKNLAACFFVALVFGGSSAYFAQENARLRDQVTLVETSSVGTAPPRTRSSRKKTVGGFLAKHQQHKTTRELLRQLIFESQSDISPKPIISELYLPQLSAKELTQLRVELKDIDCPESFRNQLLEFIAIAESRFYDGSPEELFDHLISTSEIYLQFRSDFSRWAKDDPQAAIAWFASKGSPGDFQSGSINGSDNRDALFAALLEGLAQVDLEKAIEVVEAESNQAAKRNISWSLMRKIIDDATNSESDEFVRRFLNAHPSAVVQSDNPFLSANFLTEFTRATGDLERSMALLNSLDQDRQHGVALGQIINGTNGYTFEEKAKLLTESLTTSEDLVQGVVEISTNGGPDPFSQAVHPEAIQWLKTQEDGKVKDEILASFSEKLSNNSDHSNAYQVGGQITDPIQRRASLQEVARNWFDQNPDQAAQNLPAELLQSISGE